MKAIQKSSPIWTKIESRLEAKMAVCLYLFLCRSVAILQRRRQDERCRFFLFFSLLSSIRIRLRKKLLLAGSLTYSYIHEHNCETVPKIRDQVALCSRYDSWQKNTRAREKENERRHSRTKLETLSVRIIVKAQWYIFMHFKLFSNGPFVDVDWEALCANWNHICWICYMFLDIVASLF